MDREPLIDALTEINQVGPQRAEEIIEVLHQQDALVRDDSVTTVDVDSALNALSNALDFLNRMNATSTSDRSRQDGATQSVKHARQLLLEGQRTAAESE